MRVRRSSRSRRPSGATGPVSSSDCPFAAAAVEGVEQADLGVGRELVDVVDRDQRVGRLGQTVLDVLGRKQVRGTAVLARHRHRGAQQVAATAARGAPDVEMAGRQLARGGQRGLQRQHRHQFGVGAGDEVLERGRGVGADVEDELFHRSS